MSEKKEIRKINSGQLIYKSLPDSVLEEYEEMEFDLSKGKYLLTVFNSGHDIVNHYQLETLEDAQNEMFNKEGYVLIYMNEEYGNMMLSFNNYI